MQKIITKNLKTFLNNLSLPDRAAFRNKYMMQTGISYPTWYNYSSGRTPILNLMASEKAINLVKEMHPELLYLLMENDNNIVAKEA